VLPSYCDAYRWQPVTPASNWPTVMQRNLNTALPVTVLCVGWSVGCSSWKRSAVGFCHLALTTFWNYRSAIAAADCFDRYYRLSDFHTIVLTLILTLNWLEELIIKYDFHFLSNHNNVNKPTNQQTCLITIPPGEVVRLLCQKPGNDAATMHNYVVLIKSRITHNDTN